MPSTNELTETERAELAFLKFFFKAAGDAFGPADADIYCGIAQDYEDLKGLPVPKAYDWRSDGDE